MCDSKTCLLKGLSFTKGDTLSKKLMGFTVFSMFKVDKLKI
jgi:hypothetical protein